MRVFSAVIAAALLALCQTAAAGTIDRVRESGTFTIGYRTDAPPFSYNSDIGEPAGYVVDLCREVAAAAKQELQLPDLRVAYVAVTAEDRFDAVESGRVDLLCEATTVTLARRKLVDFSLMTFIDGASVMVRANGPQSFKSLAGHKIGVHAGTTTEAALSRTLTDLKVAADMVPVADHADGVKRLESGELAAYFADRAILTSLFIEAGSPAALRVSREYFSREPYALALARGDEEFRLLVDRALARLYRSGAVEAIFARNFGKAKASDILKALYVINALPE
jgi:polar amino acid transport system substrate-binding protein/glutamate/aspartate transport system substrate-binding protein